MPYAAYMSQDATVNSEGTRPEFYKKNEGKGRAEIQKNKFYSAKSCKFE